MPSIRIITAFILILTLLSAGCTDTGRSLVESPTPAATNTATSTPTPELTPVATEGWWDDRPHYNPAIIKAEDNLFGVDIEGILYDENPEIYIRMYDENENVIFNRGTYSSFDPYKDLQPDQARALEAEYGSAKSVVMEQADTDGDGALDKVAVRYEGTKGTFTYESDNPKKGLIRLIEDFFNSK